MRILHISRKQKIALTLVILGESQYLYDVPACENGTKKNQLMLAGGVIYFF
jgi:hypothetical protein